MFLHLSVILFTGGSASGGVCIPWGSLHGGLCIQGEGGSASKGGSASRWGVCIQDGGLHPGGVLNPGDIHPGRSALGDLHPWEIRIHGGVCNVGSASRGVCIWVGQNHHPPFGYYGIRSTSGRYVVVSCFDYLYGLSLLLSIVKSHWCSCLSSTIWTNSSSVQNRKKSIVR